VCFLGLLLITGCARHKTHLEGLPQFSKPAILWKHFQKSQYEYLDQLKAVSVQGSFRYSVPQQKHRLTIHFWGNLNGPFRLNLQTNFGQLVSMWRVASDLTTAYYPQENKAVVSHNPQQTLLVSLGIHLPFSFQKILYLMSGEMGSIIPHDYQRIENVSQTRWRYYFTPKQPVQSVLLDSQGRVLQLQGSKPFTWQIDITDHTLHQDQLIGQKISLSNEFEEHFVFHLQELTLRSNLWSQQSLELKLPESTKRIYL
jgi:hypothetical protein